MTTDVSTAIRRQSRKRYVPTTRTPITLTYAPVATEGHACEVTHAAIIRRVNDRLVWCEYTICDRSHRRDRTVKELTHEPIETVTCKQCRKQLIEDGVLDPY